MSSHDSANSYISSVSDTAIMEVSLALKDAWRIFCTPLLPFLNGDLTVMELPIRSSSTMSPVCRRSTRPPWKFGTAFEALDGKHRG
ncbi:hypothetical protein TB2_028431 [Malus domestica]